MQSSHVVTVEAVRLTGGTAGILFTCCSPADLLVHLQISQLQLSSANCTASISLVHTSPFLASQPSHHTCSTVCACVQILERTPEDEVIEANLDNVLEHPHARFCTTLGSGDNRYFRTLLATIAITAAVDLSSGAAD